VEESIQEDIPMDVPSESEIKESIYESKKGEPLSKMRMALASEASIREQSKKTILKNSSEGGAFASHSFQDFKLKKFQELLLDDNNVAAFLENIEHKIEERRANEETQIHREYKQ